MNSDLAKADKHSVVKVDKYPVLVPRRMACAETAGLRYLTIFGGVILAWLAFSAIAKVEVVWQILGLVSFLIFNNAMENDSSIMRSSLDLKAKGLDIRDRRINAIMPWDWLTKVEIRQRRFSIFPNYVYFKFKDWTDVLILWDDIRETMDSTTLVSCVRTWAPRAEIVGDAKLTKSESIATYTELWLKDMSSAKSERRLRQDQTLPEGTILSNSYRIERVLSGGGQGTAYYASVVPGAEMPNVPPHVVIKEFILPNNDRGLQKATDALVKEVAILRRISHPRIVRLYDFFIEDMRGYFAIEFIDGLTLRQLVEDSGPLDDASAANVAIAVCDALTYLHELNPAIIHGDVTPDNVMVEKDGNVKIMDFDASQELTRNKTNTVVGKHAYMSPEQFKGLLVSETDIYALGCTLHFMLTGVDPEPISESHPAALRSTVGPAMNRIVADATKLKREERLADLKQMRAELERI
ncbi:MAG TPA: serine/threonine-protein kinase [Candidatus Melainabacteria bacterium]|nr:serine/threonine-protein kinase [Candidatus Melainabacteria bacterium]